MKDATITAIKETADLLYQQKTDEGYQKLNSTIGLISSMLTEEYQKSEDKEEADSKQKEIFEILEQAMNAMQDKDTIMLADILQYELLETLENI